MFVLHFQFLEKNCGNNLNQLIFFFFLVPKYIAVTITSRLKIRWISMGYLKRKRT